LKFEKKFIFISSGIIFILLFLLILSLNLNIYHKEKHKLIDNIKKELEICSYKLNCQNVDINFVKKNKTLLPIYLYENKHQFFMLFPIKNIPNYYLKLSINKKYYLTKLNKIKRNIIKNIFSQTLFILLITVFLVYILYLPLKEAYKLNETFIKDLLHDLNTPLTTLKLNLYLLKKEIKNNKRLEKIENSINAILNFQKNLKMYLSNSQNQIENFNLKNIIDEKLKLYSSIYPSIKYENSVNCKLKANKTAFEFIIDNLISNAFKYNKKNGYIKIYMKDKKLHIEDSGIGIKNPKKVFERFYKENERGIGIGLSIVKKLTDEMKINIKIISQKNKGTTVILDLSRFC